MIYADTDFFLALLKEKDWLQDSAKRILKVHIGRIWTSPTTLIELLLLAKEFQLDPERLLVDTLELAELKGGDSNIFLLAAHYLKHEGINVFDAIHAASCGMESRIISSDKVFDRLGLNRIPLEKG